MNFSKPKADESVMFVALFFRNGTLKTLSRKVLLTSLFFVLAVSQVFADQGEEPSLSVFPGGMGIHTLKPSPSRLIELMPRRVDKDSGHLVLNPGLGFVYRNSSYQFQTLFIRDSFDNPAGAITGGYEFETGYKWLDFGASLGVYARKSPRGCYQFSDGVYCYREATDIPLLFHMDRGTTQIDVTILPLLTLGTHFPLTKSVHMDISLNSALFLSFLTAGLRFDL